MEKKENIRELVTDMVTEITAGREKSHILIRNVLDKYSYLPGHPVIIAQTKVLR